jgi:hypothetical protein
MPFTVENEENSIVKFTYSDPFTLDDMKKVLLLLTKLLEKKKSFAFYIDTINANRPPLQAAPLLIKWLRDNRAESKKYIICSCVIMGGSTTSIIVKNLLQGVFKIQPTIAPNLLTINHDKGVKWVNDKVKEFNKTQNQTTNQ